MYEILIKINQWKYNMDIVESCFNFQMKIKINFPKYTLIRLSSGTIFVIFLAGLLKVLRITWQKNK